MSYRPRQLVQVGTYQAGIRGGVKRGADGKAKQELAQARKEPEQRGKGGFAFSATLLLTGSIHATLVFAALSDSFSTSVAQLSLSETLNFASPPRGRSLPLSVERRDNFGSYQVTARLFCTNIARRPHWFFLLIEIKTAPLMPRSNDAATDERKLWRR